MAMRLFLNLCYALLDTSYGQNGRRRQDEGWKAGTQKFSKTTVFMVTILNRWLSKPIKQTLRTNYDSNPLSGIIEMHCVESVPQSRLNNEILFLYSFIVFLSSLNVQRLSLSLFFFFFLRGGCRGREREFFPEFLKKGVMWLKDNNY